MSIMTKTTTELEEYIPFADISENDTEYILQADMPGVSKEGLDISIDDATLSIKGEVSKELREIYPRVYTRQFRLNISSIEQDKIKARIISGVLTLTLPKSAKAKKISISVE